MDYSLEDFLVLKKIMVYISVVVIYYCYAKNRKVELIIHG